MNHHNRIATSKSDKKANDLKQNSVLKATVTFKQQLAEAKKRLQLMGVDPIILKNFIEHNQVPAFVASNGNEEVYDLLSSEDNTIINKFRRKYQACIYAITINGHMVTLFYVSSHPEEWQMDRYDIEQRVVMAYVINRACPEFSEFGNIGFTVENGFLKRTA